MKITRKKLNEAEIPEIDPNESTAEIAADLTANVEAATDNKATLSDKNAIDAAGLIKDANKDMNVQKVAVIPTKDTPLNIINELTEVLDDAFAAAKYFRQEHISEVANVLVSGLPGSSKTATVYNWAKGKVNITYINAKNNDLDAFINGYTVQDPNDKLRVTQAVSDNLNSLDRPNSVLFIDEYNRQTKPQIRASLLTLINEHYVVGREAGGRHYFNNFLFTIAAINPAVGQNDVGAAALNDAEKSRFLFKLPHFDSKKETTTSYLDDLYTKLANRLAAMENVDEEDVWEPPHFEEVPLAPDTDKMGQWERVEALLRIRHLGTFITTHEKFNYDTEEDLNALSMHQRTMLNQRALTSGLAASRGDVNVFKKWVDTYSDFLDKDVEMLDEILNEYRVPTRDELFAALGINAPAEEENPTEEPEEEPEEEEEDDEELEDDDDFFTGSNGNNGVKILTPQETEDAINDIMANW